MISRKSLAIAIWEFKEKVRKKSFLIFTLLFPLVVIILSLAPTMLTSEHPTNNLRIIGFVNMDEQEFRLLEEKNGISERESRFIFFKMIKDGDTDEQVTWAKNKVKAGIADGLVLFNNQSNSTDLFHNNELSAAEMLLLQNLLFKVSLNKFQNKLNLTNQFTFDISPILVESENLSTSLNIFFYSFSLIVLLAFLTLFSGGTFVRSMLYEKSNGLIELYLSSCSSKELVGGKLLGLVLIGLFQTIIWLLFGLIFLSNFSILQSVSGYFVLQLIYFLLGYLLFSIIFLGAGSLISNEYQAQQVTSLLSIIIIFPLLLSVEILQSPESVLAKAMALIPFTAAPIGILRSSAGSVSMLEIMLSIFLLIASIYISVLISAKLYDASILIRSGNFSFKNFKMMNRKTEC